MISEDLSKGGPAENPDDACPACGMRYSDFLETGLLGCETCYTFFIDKILPSLYACQGTDRHVALLNEKNEDEITENFNLAKTLEILKYRVESYMREGNIEDANAAQKKINEISKILYKKE